METSKILTVEEYYNQFVNPKNLRNTGISKQGCINLMNAYANYKSKYYVQKALEAAARTQRNGFCNSEKEENKILNAYPLDNIK